MIIAPDKNKQWVQTNSSDILGNIWASFAISLSENSGTVRGGDIMYLSTNSTDQANLGVPIAFRTFNVSGTPTIFTIAGSRAFKTSVNYPAGSFTEVGSTPTDFSSDYSDLEVFNDVLYATTASHTVRTYSTGGSWSSFNAQSSADDNKPHMLCVYGGRMYMTWNGNSIVSWDTSNTTASLGSQYTITLNSSDNFSTFITFIRASSNRIWIGTLNQLGGKGYVYEWDGSSSQATKSYRIDSSGALSCIIKDDIPYIMNTNGVLQVWNGGTFKDLDDAQVGLDGRFNRIHNNLLYNPLNITNDRFIHPNGMSLIGGTIHLLINSQNFDSTGSTEVTIPAGIYEYLPKNGLYHKYAVTYVRSSDTFPYTDLGQIKISRAGALSEMNLPNNTGSRNGTFLCGATYFTNASSTLNGIWFDDSNKTAVNAGYFITSKIYSPSAVTENWQKLFLIFRKFFDANESIIVKYRVDNDDDPTEGTITWASTTSFTTTVDLSSYVVGDEVQVIQGIGSGKCAHITALTNNAGTWTVTVDETFTGASNQTAKAWFQPWKKIADFTDSNASFKEIPIGKPGTYIRFKVWFAFEKFDEIVSLITANVPNQRAQ